MLCQRPTVTYCSLHKDLGFKQGYQLLGVMHAFYLICKMFFFYARRIYRMIYFEASFMKNVGKVTFDFFVIWFLIVVSIAILKC